MSSPPLLVARGVRRAYRSGALGLGRAKDVLGAGLDLTVQGGKRVLIAGPNGSGKSTLLRVLAGVEPADAGRIELAGHSLATRAGRRSLGYAPDGCPFPMELSARHLIRLSGRLAGLDRGEARDRGDAILARVGLAADAGRPLGHYSKGMQRRFTLAQAFLTQPAVLLLDEPTDGLDAQGFGVLEALLDEARARGAAVVLASHVAALACDRIHVLMDGAWAFVGAPGELLDAPGGLLAAYAQLARPGDRAAL